MIYYVNAFRRKHNVDLISDYTPYINCLDRREHGLVDSLYILKEFVTYFDNSKIYKIDISEKELEEIVERAQYGRKTFEKGPLQIFEIPTIKFKVDDLSRLIPVEI